MQKLTFFVVTVFSAILLYFGLDTYSSVISEDPVTNELAEIEYDGYSEGINTVLYNPEGNINYTLRADRQYHLKDSTSDLEQPFIRLFRQGEGQWNIIASSGKIAAVSDSLDSEIGKIQLSGEVEVYSTDVYGNRTVLSTEYLAIDPAANTLQTDKPVSMVSTNVQQTAVGMFADFNRDELIFQEDSEGRYEPPDSK